MSSHRIHVPAPDQFDYHADREAQRVEAAKKRLDPSDILSILDGRMASQADPRQHPLLPMVEFYLDRRTAVDGAQLYDDWRQMILAAIDTALDEVLARGED